MHNPLRGVVTSEHEDDGGYRYHQGRDIGTRITNSKGQPVWVYGVGKPVYAAFGGTIKQLVRWAKPKNMASTWAPNRTGNGYLIANPDGEAQGYNHVRPIAGLKVGDWVQEGQLIGHLDLSGNMSAPHLHFETWSSWRNHKSAFSPKILFDKYKVNTMDDPSVVVKPASSKPNTTTTPKEDKLSAAEVKEIKNYIKEQTDRIVDYIAERSTVEVTRSGKKETRSASTILAGLDGNVSDLVTDEVSWTDSATGKSRNISLTDALGNLSVLAGRELERDERKVQWTDSVTGKVTEISLEKAIGNLSVLWGRELARDEAMAEVSEEQE